MACDCLWNTRVTQYAFWMYERISEWRRWLMPHDSGSKNIESVPETLKRGQESSTNSVVISTERLIEHLQETVTNSGRTIQFLPASWEGCKPDHEQVTPRGCSTQSLRSFFGCSVTDLGPILCNPMDHSTPSRTLLIPREKSLLNLTEFTSQSGTSILPWGPSGWWPEPETRNIGQNLWILKVHAQHIPERTSICSVLLPARTSPETFRFHFFISSQNVHKQNYSLSPLLQNRLQLKMHTGLNVWRYNNPMVEYNFWKKIWITF